MTRSNYDFRRSQILRGLIRANKKVISTKQMLSDAEDEVKSRLDALIVLDAEHGVETLNDETTYTAAITFRSRRP